MKKPHILIALHRFAVGGAETQARYLADFLSEKGYKVTVAAFGSENGEGYRRFNSANFKTLHWGFQEKLILYPSPSLKGKLLQYKSIASLIYQIRCLKVDVIIPFTYPPNVIFCTWYKCMGANKCFWNQRDMGIGFINSRSEKLALDNATALISNSKNGIDFLQQYSKRAIQFIPNAVKIPSKCVNPSGQPETLKLVMLANIHSTKDHLTLMKAWKVVLEKSINQKAMLILAGKKGNTFQEIYNMVINYKLENSIEFLDDLKDPYQLLSECHIGILSSSGEGMSNAVMEYMAAGLPVIVTDIPSNREILGDDYNFYFPVGNEEELAAKILELISKPMERYNLGKRNREKAKQFSSIEVMGMKYVNLISL